MQFYFLMCSERSGSNLVTKMLNAHPDICGPSTKHLLNPLARNLFRYGDLKNRTNWLLLLNDVHRLLAADFSVWRTHPSVRDLESLVAPGDVGRLVREIFGREARANGKKSVFIKENQLYEFMLFIEQHFPDALFIYQTRDPRDMALSWKNNPSHKGGVVTAAKQWKKDQQRSLMDFSTMESKGRAHRLRYEDLIAKPVETTRGVLQFLGHSHDPNLLHFHQDPITVSNARKTEAWENLERGIISGNSNKFRSGLSSDETRAVESICLHEMAECGYEPLFVSNETEVVSPDLLDSMERSELQDKRYLPSAGVRENMRAKARFYKNRGAKKLPGTRQP